MATPSLNKEDTKAPSLEEGGTGVRPGAGGPGGAGTAPGAVPPGSILPSPPRPPARPAPLRLSPRPGSTGTAISLMAAAARAERGAGPPR